MKIFLDDERAAPEGWILVKTPHDAIVLLQTGEVTMISLDHDLGLSDDQTGYTVLLWLEEQVAMNNFVPPDVIMVHTANSGARIKMDQAVSKIFSLSPEKIDWDYTARAKGQSK